MRDNYYSSDVRTAKGATGKTSLSAAGTSDATKQKASPSVAGEEEPFAVQVCNVAAELITLFTAEHPTTDKIALWKEGAGVWCLETNDFQAQFILTYRPGNQK